MNSKFMYLLCFGLGFLACYITFRIINKQTDDSVYTGKIKEAEDKIVELNSKLKQEKSVSDSLSVDVKVLKSKISIQASALTLITKKYGKISDAANRLNANESVALLSKFLSE